MIVIDEHGDNGLLTLATERAIAELLHRPTRGDLDHFRVVESQDGYRYSVEAPHPVAAAAHERLHADLAGADPSDVERAARTAVFFFEGVASTLMMSRDPSSSYLPLLATQERARELKDKAQQLGLNWDYLRPEVLESLLIPGVHRVGVNFSADAYQALAEIANRLESTKAEALRRSLRLMRLAATEAGASGKQLILEDPKTGRRQLIQY